MADYFEGVVTEYLRADRAMFVSTECFLQLEPGNMPVKGTSWYCDILAVNFRERAVYLCEVTYNKKLDALITRLQAWGDNWAGVRAALIRDCSIPKTWDIKPWVFVPQDRDGILRTKLSSLRNVGDGNGKMPTPRIEHLEAVLPWKYRSWDRNGKKALEADAQQVAAPAGGHGTS